MTDWLDELDKLERGATPGPWMSRDGRHPGLAIENIDGAGNVRRAYDDDKGMDASFIVALRNHARELIDAANENKKLRTLLREASVFFLEDEGCPFCFEGVYCEASHRKGCRLSEALK